MPPSDWVYLLFILAWFSMPLVFYWIQVVLLYASVNKNTYVYTHPEESDGLMYEHTASTGGASGSFRAPRQTIKTTGLYFGRIHFTLALIYSRKWYRVLSDNCSLLIPTFVWIVVWLMLWGLRIVSYFYLWRNRTHYNEVLFGFMAVEGLACVWYDMVWFPLLFKFRMIDASLFLAFLFALYSGGMIIARGVYYADDGLWAACVEFLYYFYGLWISLVFVHQRKTTEFMDTDLQDIWMKSPVTVFHGNGHNDIAITPGGPTIRSLMAHGDRKNNATTQNPVPLSSVHYASQVLGGADYVPGDVSIPKFRHMGWTLCHRGTGPTATDMR